MIRPYAASHARTHRAPSRNLDDERCRNGRRRESVVAGRFTCLPNLFFFPCNFATYSFVSCEPQGYILAIVASVDMYVHGGSIPKDFFFFLDKKISVYFPLTRRIHTVIFLGRPIPFDQTDSWYLFGSAGAVRSRFGGPGIATRVRIS